MLRLEIVILSFLYILSVQFAFHITPFNILKLSNHILYASEDKNPSKSLSPIDIVDQLDKELKEAFPRLSYSSLIERDTPDYEKLSPDDPLFLDMSWPTERGPEASAFAKHIQWKRRLSDGESKFQYYSKYLFPLYI
jgi:hypothetical protein